MVVQLYEVHGWQQRPALLLQAEPAAVTACAKRHNLAHRLLYAVLHAAAISACRLQRLVAVCRTILLLLLLLLGVLQACCHEVCCNLAHGCVARPCAPVDDGRLAAGQAPRQQRQHLVPEVAQRGTRPAAHRGEQVTQLLRRCC
jgi:hypothetical protein